MGTYTATAGDRAVHAKTLVAATVDTVNLGKRWSTVEVINLDGAAAIYFTIDSSTPTVGGGKTYVVPAAIGSVVVPCPSASASVQLISSGTPTYSVVGA